MVPSEKCSTHTVEDNGGVHAAPAVQIPVTAGVGKGSYGIVNAEGSRL